MHFIDNFDGADGILGMDVPTVVDTNHHSDKMTVTTNSLTSTKISAYE